MIDKYVLATNDDGDLAIRTVSATESSSVTDTTSVITATDDGKLAVRVVGAGGGGDSHNKGSFLTPEALRTAYPTAQPGDFAIVESTDTVWVWDSDTNNWKDGDTKGQVTSVNGQTGAVTVSEVPSVTGNAWKFLTTDGSTASWTSNLQISNAVKVGNSSTTMGPLTVVVGGYASATQNGAIAIGYGSTSTANMGVAVGPDSAVASTYGCAYGYGARIGNSATHAVQIGSTGSATTNSDANTFKVANANGNFEMMSADGTIPKERLTNVVTTPSTAPVLAVADWSSNTQTITVTGVTATNTVFVAPAPASAADYAAAGILCTAQAADSLTFTCTTVPSNAITLSVVILG